MKRIKYINSSSETPLTDELELCFLNQWLNEKVEAEQYELAQLIKNRIEYLHHKLSLIGLSNETSF